MILQYLVYIYLLFSCPSPALRAQRLHGRSVGGRLRWHIRPTPWLTPEHESEDMALTDEEIEAIAMDCFATDMLNPALLEKMREWSLEKVEEYFSAGGHAVPVDEHHSTGRPAVPTAAPPAFERKHERMFLCLHSSCGCGEIMQKQLAPLSLTGQVDLDFLDGEIEQDPGMQPEAAMLRRFFPDLKNRSYLRLVEIDTSGEERHVQLATNSLAAGPNGSINTAGSETADVARREYRGVESDLKLLAHKLASASLHESRRIDGCIAFSQGANLLTMALALLEAAEADARAQEEAAAAAPPGEEKVARRKAAKAATDGAARRSRMLRPQTVALFSPSDFGWPEQFASDAHFASRCLSALDDGIAAVDPSFQPPPPPAELHGVFGHLLAGPQRLLVVVGALDEAVAAGHKLARRFQAGRAHVIEHGEGHKIPGGRDQAVVQRIVNFVRMGVPDELIAGCQAWYKHRRLGWLQVKVTKVDYQGVADGGATYCVTAQELDGEVETVRERLSLSKPEE